VRPKQGAGRRRRAPGAKRSRDERPDLSKLPDDPGVYIFRDADGHPLYVGKSVCLRTRARAHFTTPVAWTGQAEHVDYQPTESELGALLLENRLIKRLLPPGNVNLKKRADGYVYLRCRLDIPFPILEVAPEPAAGLAVNVGPVRGRDAAAELVDQLNSLFALRHCGRALPRRDHPSIYGQMDRCLSPCLRDLDPNAYRRRLDEALAPFSGTGDGGDALLARIDEQMRAAAAARKYERAAVLLRRRERLEGLVARLGGLLEATHARSRLALARHPAKKQSWDAFWIVGGSVVDWGPVPSPHSLVERTELALAERPKARRSVAPDAVDEIRIVHTWIAAHDPPLLELDPPPEPGELRRWVERVTGVAEPAAEAPPFALAGGGGSFG
jgi:DNA polymerase-3 subunit epsilon